MFVDVAVTFLRDNTVLINGVEDSITGGTVTRDGVVITRAGRQFSVTYPGAEKITKQGTRVSIRLPSTCSDMNSSAADL